MKKILAEISAGELLDKITILEIKRDKILDKDKLADINKELSSLNSTLKENINLNDEVKKYSLELKTVQSSAFRILIEALKEILTDANLEFDEHCLKIIAMDASHTVLVHLKLELQLF